MKRTSTSIIDHRDGTVEHSESDTWQTSAQAVYVSGGVWSTRPTRPLEPPRAPQLEAQRYQLTSLLGEGGMGQVWLGWDRQLERHVAIKRPHDDHPQLATHLFHEATIAARLEHPNIVSIYDVYTDAKCPHFVMRLVRGQPLARHISQRTSLATLVRHLLTACEAIAHAHRRGISHRDISPMNILISEEGSTHVIDWGFAALNSSLSEQVDVIGTPGYISPEQREGQSFGPRSDVWSLGAILHFIVTGQPLTPEHPNPFEDCSAAFAREPELQAITACALHPDPDARYQDASELAHDLQRWFEGHRVRAYHVTPWRLLRHTLSQYKKRLALAALVLLAILSAISIGVINTRREAFRAQQAETLAIAQREEAERSKREAQSAAAMLVYKDALELGRQHDIVGARALALEALALEPGHPHSLGLLAALAANPQPRTTRLGTLPECEGQRWLLGHDPLDALCHGHALHTPWTLLAGWRIDSTPDLSPSQTSPRGRWLWKNKFDGNSRWQACGMQYARSARDAWRVASPKHRLCKSPYVEFDTRSGAPVRQSSSPGLFTESSDELRLTQTRQRLVDLPESQGVCADKIMNAARSPGGTVWLLCNTHEVWRLGERGPELASISPHDRAHSIVFADGDETPWIASTHGKLFAADEGHVSWNFGESVKEMRFLPGSTLLVLLGLRGKLRVFDTQARRWRFTASGHYHDIAVDEDLGLRALRQDRAVIAWTFDASPKIHRYTGPSGFSMAAWSRDQDLIVGVDGEGRVHAFAPFAGKAWEPISWFDKIGKSITASPLENDFALVGIGAKGIQRARVTPSGTLLVERDERYGPDFLALKGVLLSPSREALVLHYGLRDVIIQRPDGGPENMIDLMQDHSAPHDADTSPDHAFVVASSKSALMRWNWQEDEQADVFYTHDNLVRASSVDAHGNVLAVTKKGELLVFDEQLTLRHTWPIEGDKILDVEWVPGQRMAALAHLDGEVSWWHVDTGEVSMRGEQHSERVSKLDMSRDGRWMLSVSWDGSIVVWDLDVALSRDPPHHGLE